MTHQGEYPRPPASPFYCFAIGIAPEEGAQRAALARLEELMQRSRWLVRLRWLAACALIAATTAAAYLFRMPVPAALLYGAAAFLLGYNAIFRYLTRRRPEAVDLGRDLPRSTVLATLQIVIDLAVLTVLLHFTGGVENPFFFYFIFHIIIASILLSRAASFYIATLAVALFGALALAHYSGLLTHHAFWPSGEPLHSDPLYVFGVLTVFTTTMYLAVYFAGDTVERLRERDRELINVSVSLERGTLQLQQAYDKIRALEARKSDFMRTAAHQLRSPLSAIRSLLDVVIDGFASQPERRAEMLERAHDRADMMLDMVNELLVLSRLKDAAEPIGAPVEDVELCAVLADLAAFYAPRAQQKGVTLRMEPPPISCRVAASADDMRQVLNNLLDNAINYTPAGGSVTCRATLEAGRITLTVADTGIGIPAEALPRIFEEFYRAPNAKTVSSHGTGLGLAIVKRTVEKWRGSVSVESAKGRGTAFTVEFPAPLPTPGEAAAALKAAEAEGDAAARKAREAGQEESAQ